MSIFRYYLIKDIFLVLVGFVCPPLYFLLRGKFLLVGGCLLLYLTGSLYVVYFVCFVGAIAALIQLRSDVANRAILEANAQYDPVFRFLGKNFGLFKLSQGDKPNSTSTGLANERNQSVGSNE